ADPALRANPRRRAQQPRPRRRTCGRHDRHRRPRQRGLSHHPHPRRTVAQMKSAKLWSWIIFAIGVLYFLGPLLATVQFSLSIRRTGYSLDAYTNVLQSPIFQQTFLYSLTIGVAAIIVGLFIVVPAAYFVRLRAPQLRPIIEFVTLLPLIIPPIILVFGYIRLYNSSSILPLTNTDIGTNILLTLAY